MRPGHGRHWGPAVPWWSRVLSACGADAAYQTWCASSLHVWSNWCAREYLECIVYEAQLSSPSVPLNSENSSLILSLWPCQFLWIQGASPTLQENCGRRVLTLLAPITATVNRIQPSTCMVSLSDYWSFPPITGELTVSLGTGPEQLQCTSWNLIRSMHVVGFPWWQGSPGMGD